jgi:hypothetical protein
MTMTGAKTVPEQRQRSLNELPEEIDPVGDSALDAAEIHPPLPRRQQDIAPPHFRPGGLWITALKTSNPAPKSSIVWSGSLATTTAAYVRFVLHAVCDGLMHMSCHNILYICNPATMGFSVPVGRRFQRVIGPYNSTPNLSRLTVD